jgi:putative tricarboxylic transport membrane protein
MKKAHILAHAFWLVFACAAAAESWRLGFGSLVRPGPGFVPFLAALVLGGLAVAALVQTILDTSGPAAGGVFDIRDLLRVLWVIVVLAAYVLVWDIVGFLAATLLLLFFLFRCVEPLRWRTVLIASVLTLTMTYILFSTLLGARLPAGRIWTYFMN